MKTIKFTFPILFLLFGILISCKTTKEAVVENVEETQEIMEIPVTSFEEDEPIDGEATTEKVKQGDSLFASIERSPCFGMCPTYKMRIYTDGSVVLETTRAVRLEKGTYTAQISEKEMKQFTDVANSIEFMKLKNKYDSPVTDIPSTTLTIVMDGMRKEVYARANYPQRIKEYAKLFDALIEKDIWTEVK